MAQRGMATADTEEATGMATIPTRTNHKVTSTTDTTTTATTEETPTTTLAWWSFQDPMEPTIKAMDSSAHMAVLCMEGAALRMNAQLE